MSKYHVNSKGDVLPCKAQKRACRFVEEEHFNTLEEGQKYVEEKLAKEYTTTSTLTKRKDAKEKEQPNNNPDTNTIKQKIHKQFFDNTDDREKAFAPETLMSIGKVVEEELQKRLSFNINEKLTEDDYKTLEKETHKLMSELTDNGASLSNPLYGSMTKDLNKAVSVLPNSVKKNVENTPIFVKALRKDNSQFDGMHSGNKKFNIYTTDYKEKIGSFEKEDTQNIPHGATYIKDFMTSSDMNSPYFGIRAKIKDENSDEYKVVWIGYSPSPKTTGKKLSDTSEVYVNGKLTKLDKPTYEYKVGMTKTGSVINVKKIPFENSRNSVLLHEYTHLVQMHDYSGAEEKMFNNLRESDKPVHAAELDDSVFEGFPDTYMGLYNGRELLTRATEGLYYPSASPYLYSDRQGKNADKVRQWVMGYWLSKDNFYKNKQT